MNNNRDIFILSISLAATCLLFACSSSDETKRDDQHVAQPQTKETVAPMAKKEGEPPLHKGDDYLHGTAMGLSIGLDEVNVKETIKYQLQKNDRFLDLHLLENYSHKVTKDDLQVLRSSEARAVCELNLGGLGLSDNDLEAISGLPLERLEVDGNDLKDLHALKGMTKLKNMKLCDDPINSEGMRVIGSFHNLQTVDMQRTTVCDSDLPQFYGLKKMRFLNLGACARLTPSAVEHLKNKIPNCEVGFDVASSRKFKNGFDTLNNVASTLIDQGEYDEADAAIAKIVSRWEGQSKPPYELIVQGYRQRALCQDKMRRPRAQLQMLVKSLEVYCQHLPDDQNIPDLEMECSEIFDRMNDSKAALAMNERADAFWKVHPPPPARRWKNSLNMSRLGYHLITEGDYKKAQRTFERALQWIRQYIPDDIMQTEGCKQGIAWCEFKSGDAKSAAPIMKEALQIYEKGKDKKAQCEAGRMLAEIYMKQGNKKDAEALLKKGIDMPVSDEKRAQMYGSLVAVLRAENKQDEAEHYAERFEKVTGRKLPEL